MDLGQGDIGAQLPRVERDRLFQVGDGLVQLPALQPDEAAIDQERVPEPAARIAPERLAIIGKGGSVVCRCLYRARCPRTHLSRGEPTKQIEPGQLGMALQASGQIGLGRFGAGRPDIQVADGQQALGPEMVRLGLQGLGEMSLGLRHIAAFVVARARSGSGRTPHPAGVRSAADRSCFAPSASPALSRQAALLR